MRKSYKHISILALVVSLTFSACKNDSYVRPTVVITGNVSFDTIIQPILTTNCAVSGCHLPGAQIPDLSAENSWNNLWNYGLIDTAAATATTSIFYEHLTATGGKPLMPPVGSLSPTQIGDVLAWIKQGGQNN
jgi:hypothetical protein